MEAEQVIRSPITQNEFCLQQNIGSGTFAQCWSAINTETRDKVCLKIVEYYLLDEGQRTVAQREAHVHAPLLCPSIVRFQEAFFFSKDQDETQMYFCIVMELGECALDGYLAEHAGFFSPRELLAMCLDCVMALKYLHARQLAHRDFSTKNLLVFHTNNELRLKLCDFGVSTVLQENALATTQIGTPSTMAPEIFDAKGYGPKADVYAAGCVCYELFTRTQMFAGMNYLALIKALEAYDGPSFPDQIKWAYSKSFVAFMMELLSQMLHKDPEQRLDSASVEMIIKARIQQLVPEEEIYEQFPQEPTVVPLVKAKSLSQHDDDHMQRRGSFDLFNQEPIIIDYQDGLLVARPAAQANQKTNQHVNNHPQPLRKVTKQPTSHSIQSTPTTSAPDKKKTSIRPGLNIAEMKRKYQGKSRDFEVEIFTGLTPEVEEQVNNAAQKK